jgi:hypothetical protein
VDERRELTEEADNRRLGIFTNPHVSKRGSVYARVDESGHVTNISVTKRGGLGSMMSLQLTSPQL